MRIKIFKSELLKEVEMEINNFLMERKDIKVVDIKEVHNTRFYVFMLIYECKE